MMRFLKEKSGQISAEMIIVMAALLGIAIILITKLTSSAEESSKILDKKGDEINNLLDDIGSDLNE